MKKIIAFASCLCICISLVGCTMQSITDKIAENNISGVDNVVPDDKSGKYSDNVKMPALGLVYESGDEIYSEEVDIERTVELNGRKYNVEFDFEAGIENYDRKIDLEINNVELAIREDYWYYGIKSVYLYDVNANDGYIDALIFTSSDNDWVDVIGYRFTDTSTRKINTEEISLGTSESNFTRITLDNEGLINCTIRTESTGMWGVKAKFEITDNEVMREIKPDKYEVDIQTYLAAFGYLFAEDFTVKDFEMIEKGYVPIGKDYEILRKGEYFTVLYDDGNDNIYVKTTDGKEGWINISLEAMEYYDREAISRIMFFMAG